MQASLHLCELVVSGSRVAADAHVFPQQVLSLSKLTTGHAQIGHFQQCIGKLGVDAKRLLEHGLSGGRIALPLSDEAEVEQAGGVARIEFEPLLEILLSFVESPKVPVGESEEGVGARRAFDLEEFFELFNGLVDLAGHEVAFA